MPFGLGGFFSLEVEYDIYIISLLVITALQSLFIYKEITFKTPYTKSLAMIILIASLWFLWEYVAPLTVVKPVEEDILLIP
jgi:hypothetical protein